MKRFGTPYWAPFAPGRRANVKIDANAPQYPALAEATKTVDAADWKYVEGQLWVSLNMLETICGHPRPSSLRSR